MSAQTRSELSTMGKDVNIDLTSSYPQYQQPYYYDYSLGIYKRVIKLVGRLCKESITP